MKNLSLYQNLDTSFVNLSSLVRYLRGRGFTGNVRFELNGYEAEILFSAGGEIVAREHDRSAGRIAEGEEAFQRLLIRAREPGGTIHVFQTIEETEAIEPAVQIALVAGNAEAAMKREFSEPEISGGDASRKITFSKPPSIEFAARQNTAPPPPSSSPLPLEFSNRVEEKARQTQMTTGQDWQTLLDLAGELLGAIDQTLAAAKLDFVSAFTKARAEIAADYPFLNPASGVFQYSNGRVTLKGESVNPKLFAASLNESLRRILEKLGSNSRFSEVYRAVVQSILALIHQRKPLYDKFFITPQLEKILGV